MMVVVVLGVCVPVCVCVHVHVCMPDIWTRLTLVCRCFTLTIPYIRHF